MRATLVKHSSTNISTFADDTISYIKSIKLYENVGSSAAVQHIKIISMYFFLDISLNKREPTRDRST